MQQPIEIALSTPNTRSTIIAHMFDADDAPQAAPTAADLQRLLEQLATLDGTAQDGAVRSEAEHIDLIAALERLKAG